MRLDGADMIKSTNFRNEKAKPMFSVYDSHPRQLDTCGPKLGAPIHNGTPLPSFLSLGHCGDHVPGPPQFSILQVITLT